MIFSDVTRKDFIISSLVKMTWGELWTALKAKADLAYAALNHTHATLPTAVQLAALPTETEMTLCSVASRKFLSGN